MINLWSHTGCLIQLDRRKQMCQSTSLLSNSLQFDTVPVNNIFTLSKSDLCVLMSIRFSVSFWTRTFLSRVSGLHPADADSFPPQLGHPKTAQTLPAQWKTTGLGAHRGPAWASALCEQLCEFKVTHCWNMNFTCMWLLGGPQSWTPAPGGPHLCYPPGRPSPHLAPLLPCLLLDCLGQCHLGTTGEHFQLAFSH